MRALLLVVLVAILWAPGPSEAQSEGEPDVQTYEVPRLQRINRAIDVLEASGVSLDDFDLILYSTKPGGLYLITFTTELVFVEENSRSAFVRKGEDVRMLFSDETEKLIALEADPLPRPPKTEE